MHSVECLDFLRSDGFKQVQSNRFVLNNVNLNTIVIQIQITIYVSI